MTVATNLAFDVIDVPPYAARFIKQSMSVIGAALNQRRTINGYLDDLSRSQFQKFTTKIVCSDVDSPSLGSVPVGLQVTVDWTLWFTYRTAGGVQSRPAVPGSLVAVGAFMRYRPRMIMRVTNYTTDYDATKADVAWELDLEEI